MVQLGDTFIYKEEEFICIQRQGFHCGENICGINVTHVFVDNPQYKYKINYFFKNASGYKIACDNGNLKLEIFETGIDHFGHYEVDETKITEYLGFIENLYNEYNEKHQIQPLQQSLYHCK